MRAAAAIAFAAALAAGFPATAAQTSCADARLKGPMIGCLVRAAEPIVKGLDIARVGGAADALRETMAQIAEARGDAGLLEDVADDMTSGRMLARALASKGVLLARKGDARGVDRVLARFAKEPALKDVGHDAVATILAAQGDLAKMRAHVDAQPPQQQAVWTLRLALALAEAKKYRLAGQLLDAAGDRGEVPPMATYAAAVGDVAAAGQLDLARKLQRLLPSGDRARVDARIALTLDEQGRTQEAQAIVETLLRTQTRSTEPRLVAAVLAARHGDFAAAQARFPAAMYYDADDVAELAGLLAKAGETERADAMFATMNNRRDRVAAFAAMATALVRSGKPAEAEAMLAKARQILDPIVALRHGAAPQLIDFAGAMRGAVEALLALGRADEARALVERIEKAVQTDPYGVARVMRGLIGINEVLYAHMAAAGDIARLRDHAAKEEWRTAAARTVLLRAGKYRDAVLVAEAGKAAPPVKAGDFLAIALYIARH
jgi:tetratricopeptide (TPR) repeat protein